MGFFAPQICQGALTNTPIGDKLFQHIPRRVVKFRANRPRDGENLVDGKKIKKITRPKYNSLPLSRATVISGYGVRCVYTTAYDGLFRPIPTESVRCAGNPGRNPSTPPFCSQTSHVSLAIDVLQTVGVDSDLVERVCPSPGTESSPLASLLQLLNSEVCGS